MNEHKGQVTEEIGLYIDEMRAAHPAIDEVWLVGARLTEPARRDTVWELLLFADAATAEALGKDRERRRDDVALHVVVDGGAIETLSGEPLAPSLEALGWGREDADTADYARDSERHAAARLR